MGHGDTVDYCKINQMVMPVVAIVLDVVALLEQISIAHGTSYVAIDMTDAFFLFQSVRKIRSSFLLNSRDNTNLNCFAPGLCPSLAICHKIVLRVLDHLQIPQEIMPIHYIEDTMQQVLIRMM